MYLAKMALLYKHAVPDGQAFIFYMDIRVTGKGYEEFIQRTVEEAGAVYLRGRVSKVFRDGDKIMVWGADTLTGKRVEIAADLVVLGMAITPNTGARDLASKLGIAIDEYGFMAEIHTKLRPLETAVPGIFLAGMAQGPKDIPDSVAQASGAASKAMAILAKDELILEKAAAS
jgi:heterodisulfide reductase subunit A